MEPRAGLILANRAYCDHDQPPAEERGVAAGNGGLLAALRPAIAPWVDGAGTTWIGAGRGACDRAFTDEHGVELIQTPRGPLRHRRLYFDDESWQGHYADAANDFLWPLVHLVTEVLPRRVSYYPEPKTPTDEAWEHYRSVNRAFAEAAMSDPDAESCWVHDYQLALVPGFLREAGAGLPIGFFLHTPFPELAVARQCLDDIGVERFRDFLRGILGADLVGLQTEGDVTRLKRAASALGLGTAGEAGVHVDGRAVPVGAYPVGIDPEEVRQAASRHAFPAEVAQALVPGLPLVVGLERADFTKGIPERLGAIADVFERGIPFAYAGIAAPTREGVTAYDALGPAIAAGIRRCTAAAERVGGRFIYAETAVEWSGVVAVQQAADVVFTSSLADGMNLVPLQTVIAQAKRPQPERGVIITGRDAGVARAYAGYEKDGLVPVDPLDPAAMATALAEALAGRPGRISDRLVAAVRENDARAWAARFLGDLQGLAAC